MYVLRVVIPRQIYYDLNSGRLRVCTVRTSLQQGAQLGILNYGLHNPGRVFTQLEADNINFAPYQKTIFYFYLITDDAFVL